MYNKSKRQEGEIDGIWIMWILCAILATILLGKLTFKVIGHEHSINSLEHNVCQLSVMQEQYPDPNDTTERSKALKECME